jgi:RimJ/RimL family protein N-acetyltransferase
VEAQRAALGKYIDCKDTDGVIVFGIDSLAGVTVGGVSLHSRDQKNGTFSFGVVVYREHWGQGYAEDAVRILLRYGFWEQRYQKCDSACLHANEASIRLHKKLGFIEEGRRRRQTFFNGQYYDSIEFGMTREEFDAHEAARSGVAPGAK